MEYLNLNKTSKVTKISAKRLQYLCRTKSIKGAKKINNKWYIPKKSIQNLKNSTPKRSLLKIIITVFSIIGGIAAILTIFEFATDHLLSKKISSSFIIPETEPARENELLIIVMDFEKKGNLEYDISGRITEVLVKTLTWIPGSSIRVEQIKEFIPRSEMFVPSTVGAKYGAAILIWGSYDDASIKPSFAIPSTLPYSSLHSKHPTGVKVDPKLSRIANEIGLINKTNIPLRLRNNEFSLGGIGTEFTEFPAIGENRINYINDILPNSMIYLSSLVTGIYYYLNEKILPATKLLDLCINISNIYDIKLGLHEAYYYRGMISLYNKEYDKAIYYYNKAIDLNSQSYRAFIYRAHIHRLNNELEKSKTDCEYVLKENFSPGFYITKANLSNLYLYYARTCLDLKLYKISEKYFKKLIDLKVNDSKAGILLETYSNLGFLNYLKNDLNSSKYFLNQAISKDSTNAYPYFWLSKVFQKHSNLDSMNIAISKYKYYEKDTLRLNYFLNNL